MTRKMLVPLQLPANPTLPLEAATKAYVDGVVVSGGWHSVRVGDLGISVNTWTININLTLTGCPTGAVVALVGTGQFVTPTVCNIFVAIDFTAPAPPPPAAQNRADVVNGIYGATATALLTTTAANQVVSLWGQSSAASTLYRGSSLLAWRVA